MTFSIYYIGFHYLFSVFMNKNNKDIYFSCINPDFVVPLGLLLGEMLCYDIYHNSNRFIKFNFYYIIFTHSNGLCHTSIPQINH